METSDTSSDIKIDYLDKQGNDLNITSKPISLKKDSSTDYYLNMIANQDKKLDDTTSVSSSELSILKSETSHSVKSTSSKKSTKSQPVFENISINTSDLNIK